MKLIVVSGLSGSGKSVALNMLEDLDYYCIDNLPLAVLEDFVRSTAATGDPAFERLAVGIDARARTRDIAGFEAGIHQLNESGVDTEVIFLQADNDIILKRYSETRRKHPLTDENTSLFDAIRSERALLAPIAENADLVLDTTHTNMHELRDLVRERVHGRGEVTSLLLESFGYKHGLPEDADFVFDSRCLPNPHWDAELRRYSGRDTPVIEYLEAYPVVTEFLGDLRRLLDTWLPRFEASNRSYLTVAIGCTGGHHRSVYIVEQLAGHFRSGPRQILVRHRELPAS